MLKIILLLQIFIINKVFIINKLSGIKSNNKLIKKFVEPKTKKLFKSQKLAKLKKKLLKSGNLPNFKAKKNRSSFLIFKAKSICNCL